MHAHAIFILCSELWCKIQHPKRIPLINHARALKEINMTWRCDPLSNRTSSRTITVVLFIPVYLRHCFICTCLLTGDRLLVCCPSDLALNVNPAYDISLRAKAIAVNTCHFINARLQMLTAVLNATRPSRCIY